MIAIGFDLDHTLGTDNKLERTAFVRLAERLARNLNINFDPNATTAVIDRELATFRVGASSLDDAIDRAFSAVLGDRRPADCAREFRAFALSLVPEFVRALPGVPDTLQKLTALGVPLAVLSNGWSPLQNRKAEAVGFSGPVLVSETLGVQKPARAAFAALVETLHVAREQIWYVGDDPYNDVCGALAAGLNAAWFDSENRSYPDDLSPPTRVIHRFEELLEIVPPRPIAATR